LSPFFRAIAVLTMATSTGLEPEIAWPLTMLSVDAPMFTGFAGWVDPEKYTAGPRLPGRNDVRAEAAAALRVSSMLVTPCRCAMGASSAVVRFFVGCPPTEKAGGAIVTVLPIELSVVATLPVTELFAISMTKDKPIASPRIPATEIVRTALRKAFRMPLPTAVI
jgi:hypothetical protein